MLFLISNDEGRIVQANKVFTDVEKYEAQLRDNNIAVTKVKHHSLLAPDRWMVNKNEDLLMRVKKRPTMTVAIDKTTIKAGGSDKAVLTGAPKDVRCCIVGGGETLFDVSLPDGELELGIPVPIVYVVRLIKWPYVDFTATIEAVA